MVRKPLQLYVIGLGEEKRLQQSDQLVEGGPLLGVFVPAVVHDVVELSSTVVGLVQSIAVADSSHHFRRRQPRVRRRTQRHHLPDQHSETPHVGLDREDVVVQGLRGHPSDRQAALGLALVDVTGDDVTGKTEVRHFAHLVLTHEDVAGRQVAVDYLKGRK